ncbi:MAG: DNA alkylation repair protein [Gammaproteobacteria bacterium]|nr:MAG: DNA alkylation repair protein [Gammaproteobacteria bacterium]
MILTEIRTKLGKLASKRVAEGSQRFFKTGPGEYGFGDVFIGVRVPRLRRVAKQCDQLALEDVRRLLRSSIHEERLLALFVLVHRFTCGDAAERRRIYEMYLRNTRYVNNWDLVDGSAEHIVGAYLLARDRTPIYRLARSRDLWQRRIAIMSTFHYIKRKEFSDTIKLAGMLCADEEDLIHKAVGWMLREIGKRDLQTEERFLLRHYKSMPRTMLRYAIERFPECKRQAYLKGRI